MTDNLIVFISKNDIDVVSGAMDGPPETRSDRLAGIMEQCIVIAVRAINDAAEQQR